LDTNEDSGDDETGVVVVVLDDDPDQEDGGDQEKNRADKRIDLLQLVRCKSHEVEDEQHNVDDDANEVQAGGESDTSFAETRTSSDPSSAQNARDDESDDDLGDLDNAAVGRKVAGVDGSHC